MNYSTTQATNIASLAGVIVLILRVFKVEVAQDDLVAVMAAVVTIAGIVGNYVHRYKKGDVTVAGFRK